VFISYIRIYTISCNLPKSDFVETSVETSGDVARSRYTEMYDNWSIQIITGYYRIFETYVHMNMSINVYEP